MPNKAAIITGAGTGVGRALAEILAADGTSLVITGRSPEPLEELRRQLESKSEIAVVVADITDDATPKSLVDTAMERFGRLDYLVNNAGIGKPMPVHETTDDWLDTYLNVLLRSPFRLCREALAVMQDGASIVNVASTAAVIGILRSGAYAAAKAGLVGLSQHMAAQYGPRGIRTNVVAPGVLETPMTAYAWETARFRRMNFDMTPLNRTGRAEDAAAAIAFLLSDAARFITGQVIVVDGGWSATKFLSEEAVTAIPAVS